MNISNDPGYCVNVPGPPLYKTKTDSMLSKLPPKDAQPHCPFSLKGAAPPNI